MAEFDEALVVYKSYRRTSLTKRLVVKLERIVTRTQEWLEGEDKLPSKAVGYGVVILTGIFMLGQIVRCFV